jgi:hypothetical protein
MKKKALQKKAWFLMSKYVRARDGNRCFTCDKVTEKPHAGHFKHAPKSNQVSYDFRNINCQCVSCNTFGNGKLDVYAERLVARYGEDVLSDLSRLKFEGRKMDVEWWENKIKELEGLIDAL